MIVTDHKADKAFDLFLKSVRKFNLLTKGDSVLVAVSGGPDSIALFDLLYRIRVDWHLDLHIAHLNHSLRGEASDKDQQFAEKFARDLKFPIVCKKVDVGQFARDRRMSIEEAARECRLQFFQEEARRLGLRKVALGHHRDDQAETVLLRILRGTGLRGLGAMKPVSDWNGLILIRPLIELEKKDLNDYVRDRKLTFCVDLSNQDPRFMRNRIRQRLIPDLERYYNPRIKNALANLAETVSLDLAFIEELMAKQYPKVIKKKKEGLLILKKKKFLQQPEALRFRVLQKAVRDLEPESELDYFHWDEFRRALEQSAGRYEIHLPNDVSVALERKEIILKKHAAGEAPPFEYQLRLGDRVVVRELGLEFVAEAFEQRVYKVDRKDRTSGIFDLEKIHFPLVIRNRREGDVFRPLGLHYPKKLKDFFIARKVPSYEKDRVPLFVSGNEIFWVYGIEISDPCKVTHKTRRFLKLSSRPV
ncbi:MAG: tRNA lysidine(34) synthetase TilS [Candidatus Omnitrophica bacterium]|nr:tRNA lysidine(34) synthetase TilS [Candidatus Omnitrophota bacterium]